MTKNFVTKTFDLGNNKTISLETGKLAKQADGSVVVRCGDAMLLATVVASKDARPGIDFLPLSVDYQEKYAGAGRIPGGFLRREARLSDYEILISRLVDRALRPLFPDDYHADIQVVLTLISADKTIMPDALAGLAASTALLLSDIPFNGPISECRISRIKGEFLINPTVQELENSDLDILVAGTEKDIVMMEGEMKEVSEEDMIHALQLAHEAIKLQIKAQWELVELVGKKPVREYSHETNDQGLKDKIHSMTYEATYKVAKAGLPKEKRSEGFKSILNNFLEKEFTPETINPETHGLAKKYFHEVEKLAVRNLILEEGIRLDGRKAEEIRPIWSEVNYIPSAHGSAVFTRGETQSLTTVTLGGKDDEQLIDGAMFFGDNRFMLHYNFPAFSTGEVRPNRGPGRREIGHGNLALRALRGVLPSSEENPYTLRIVSDILESNGSSSMATVCAGTLALMDAGIKIKAPVSGIAMGLIMDSTTGKYAVLSDILGDEDHLGDMDFKVTGTSKGITACQMDIKVDGLSYEVLAKALAQAKQGRIHILGELDKTLSKPREDYKSHAPRIVEIRILKEFIGAVIGPGGKIIQEMQRETGTQISIEEKDNMGIVQIMATDKESLEAAVKRINGITTVAEIGEIYDGIVKSIMPFGAFVEYLPGKDGLLHISEIDHRRIETMDGVFEIGDKLQVKLLDIDKKTGKVKLSRKALIEKPQKSGQESFSN